MLLQRLKNHQFALHMIQVPVQWQLSFPANKLLLPIKSSLSCQTNSRANVTRQQRSFSVSAQPQAIVQTLFKRPAPNSPVMLPIQEKITEAENSVVTQTHNICFPIEKLFIPPGIDSSQLLKAQRLQGSNIIVSPYAGDAQIKKAEFVKSSSDVDECPLDDLPEFALVGRSNVGKSSVVNMLVKRKQLAMTSKKPGKTQLINHFLVDDSWYLVDLPGYGYAVAPVAIRTEWNEFTKNYFLKRRSLVSVLLLIDASIPAKKIDIECATWLGQNQIPMTFVFTKCDKRKKKKHGNKSPEENVHDFQNIIREFYKATPPWIMTSSVTKEGRDELLLHISQLRNYWLKH